MVVLAGIGGVTLAAWLGWGNWQRNGRRGKVALLEVLRFVAVAMLAFTLLRPEFVRLIQRTARDKDGPGMSSRPILRA